MLFPLFLSQDYPPGFQVIIVQEKSDSETDDIIKLHSSDERLYSTFVPDSSRYMSRPKLAVTLGVKAAKYDWVVIADVRCAPASTHLFEHIGNRCKDGTDMISVYTNYDQATPPYWRFERFLTNLYLMREYANSTAYRCEDSCLVMRKQMFIDGDAYRGNLKYLRGELDFIVNKYAKDGNTTSVNAPEARLIEEVPTRKTLRNKHVYYLETRKHLMRSKAHRIPFNIDMTMCHLAWLVILGVITTAAILQDWIALGAGVLSIVIYYLLRMSICRKAFRSFSEKLSVWKAPFFELSLFWHDINYRVHYGKADKYDFITHKL